MIKYGVTIILSILLSTHTLMVQNVISFPFRGYDEDTVIQVGIQYNYINQNYK